MKKLAAIVFLSLALLAAPLSAATTGLHKIWFFKVMGNGLLVGLEGFGLEDVDPTACADPGSKAYFYLSATSAEYHERYAALLSAFLSDRPVNISYYACGDYAPGASYIKPASVTIHRN